MERKLDVGQVVGEVFQIYKDQAAVLLPAAAAIFFVEAILAALLFAGLGLIGVILAIVISLVATTFFTGMVVELVRDVQDGRRDSSVSDLFKAVAPVVLPLVAASILAGIGIGLGFLLLIIPGLFLLTIWAVLAPVIVLERAGVFGAFGRSQQLVKGNLLPVFGAIVIFFLINLVVGFILSAIGGAAGDVGVFIAQFLTSVITAPLSALVAAVLYFRLRGDGDAPAAQPADTLAAPARQPADAPATQPAEPGTGRDPDSPRA
jgi:hypothetical protein